MEIKTFWEIIGLLDWQYEGDNSKVLAPAVERLSTFTDEEIFAFENLLSKLLYDLDSREIALELCGQEGLTSDDMFLYQRCVAVANGEQYYRSILGREKRLDPDMEFEALLYLPQDAWAKRNREDSDEYPHFPAPSYETGSNKALWNS